MSRQLVFFDKHKKLQGPYSERKIQEWYRAGWFDREFRFSFLAPPEQHNDKTPAYLLNELISHHGHGAPFGGPPSAEFGQKECERSKRLDRLEKQIADARSTVDSISTLTQRLEKAEQQLKMLTVTPSHSTPHPSSVSPPSPTTPSNTTVKQELKKPDETPPPSTTAPSPASPTTHSPIANVSKRVREECEELATLVAEGAFLALDVMGTCEYARFDVHRCRSLYERVNAFVCTHEFDEAAQKLATSLTLRELERLFDKREYIYCTTCNGLALNARCALIHYFATNHPVPSHIHPSENGQFYFTNMIAPLVRLNEFLLRWSTDEYAKVVSQKKPNPGAYPTRAFMDQLEIKYHVHVVASVMDGRSRLNIPSVVDLVPTAVRLMKGDLGTNLMRELNAHIGNNITGCCRCGALTGTREAYDEHMRSWTHSLVISQTPDISMVTIALNCR